MTPEESLRRTINEAVESAVRRVLAERPAPSCVSIEQAAEMLGVSRHTVARMKPPRNAVGKIPYEWVLEARSAR
jgi:DNA invertase Pin-like site-specific DNA recombinase